MSCNCNTNSNQYTFEGNEMKMVVTLTAEGFSMLDDDWKVVFTCGRKSLEFTRADAIIGEDDTVMLIVDTSQLGAGQLIVTGYAYVPDADLDKGYRVEVDEKELFPIKALKGKV